MDKSVIIKSNKNGLVLILDKEIEFSELIIKITDKFKEAKKFFGKCEMVLSVSGRTLSNAELKQVVDVIHTETEIEIIMVSEDSDINNDLFLKALKKLDNKLDTAFCEIVNGDVESGKNLSFKHNVIVLGNICENAEVHTDGSIFVIGSLIGSCYAGELGNTKATVFAADMRPDTVMINDVYFKMPKLVDIFETKTLFGKKTEEFSVKKSMLVYLLEDSIKYEILN